MGDFDGLGFGSDGFGADDFAKLNLGSQMLDDVDDISPGREYDQPDLYKKYWGEDEKGEDEDTENGFGEEDVDLDSFDADDDAGSDDYDSEDRNQFREDFSENMERINEIRDALVLKGYDLDDFSCDHCNFVNPYPDAEPQYEMLCANIDEVEEAIDEARSINKYYPFDIDDLQNKTPGAFCWYFSNPLAS